MDTFTHAMTGIVIARAIEDKRLGNWGDITGLSMGIFPDSDFILGLFNNQFYIQYHRDFTHSLILIPFYSLFFSWLFKRISRRHHFWSFYKISLTVLLSHVILDLLTSYGTMVFSPLFEKRFSFDLIFIFDLIFSGIIFLPLVISLFWKSWSRLICGGSIILLTIYVLFCLVQHERAVGLAKDYAKNLHEEVIQVSALPQPLSPFRWTNYIETRKNIFQGFVDLKRSKSPLKTQIESDQTNELTFFDRFKRLDSLYQPPNGVKYRLWQKRQDSPWVEKALSTEGTRFYFWFARFPVVKSVNLKDGHHRVEFMDLRFLLPDIRTPFVFYVEFDDSGELLSEGFVRDERGRKDRKI